MKIITWLLVREDQPDPQFVQKWEEYVAAPSRAAGAPAPKLVRLPSPYRKLYGSLLKYIDEVEAKHPARHLAILMPNLSEARWYHFSLHNHRAVLLNAILFMRRDPKVNFVTIPWYLPSAADAPAKT